MNKYIARVLVGAAALVVLPSCNKLLDEVPDTRIYVETPDNVKRLLAYAYSSYTPAVVMEYASDNIRDNGTIATRYTRFIEDIALWRTSQSWGKRDDFDNLWEGYYKAIQHANKALEVIEALGTPEELLPYKGEALIARSYAYFMLVNLFGKPYNATTSSSDPAVPLILKPEVNLYPKYERNTVAELYAQITKDFEEGYPLIKDEAYDYPKYHFNTNATYAFGARLYMQLNKWDQVIEFASKVVDKINPRSWQDFNNISIVGAKTKDAFAKLYAKEELEANLMILPTYSDIRTTTDGGELRYSHNQQLSDSELYYNQPWSQRNSQNRFIETYPYTRFGSYYAAQNYALLPRFPETPKGGWTVTIPFTSDDLLLSRAEAYILKGQYDEAMADLNKWTQAYLLPTVKNSFTKQEVVDFYKELEYESETVVSTKKKLAPSFTLLNDDTQEYLLDYVLQCRRLVNLHEGLRWLDLRRYGITIYRKQTDLRNVNNLILLGTLKPGDEGYTFEIPQKARVAGIKPTRSSAE